MVMVMMLMVMVIVMVMVVAVAAAMVAKHVAISCNCWRGAIRRPGETRTLHVVCGQTQCAVIRLLARVANNHMNLT